MFKKSFVDGFFVEGSVVKKFSAEVLFAGESFAEESVAEGPFIDKFIVEKFFVEDRSAEGLFTGGSFAEIFFNEGSFTDGSLITGSCVGQFLTGDSVAGLILGHGLLLGFWLGCGTDGVLFLNCLEADLLPLEYLVWASTTDRLLVGFIERRFDPAGFFGVRDGVGTRSGSVAELAALCGRMKGAGIGVADAISISATVVEPISA